MSTDCLVPDQARAFNLLISYDLKLEEKVEKAAKDCPKHEGTNRIDKEQEVLVVPLGDAISHPWTVMVELKVACATVVTVNCP